MGETAVERDGEAEAVEGGARRAFSGTREATEGRYVNLHLG